MKRIRKDFWSSGLCTRICDIMYTSFRVWDFALQLCVSMFLKWVRSNKKHDNFYVAYSCVVSNKMKLTEVASESEINLYFSVSLRVFCKT